MSGWQRLSVSVEADLVGRYARRWPPAGPRTSARGSTRRALDGFFAAYEAEHGEIADDEILTADPDDLRALAAAAGAHVEFIAV